MAARVTLTVVKGPFTGEVYEFEDRTLCTVGRARDCFLRFPGESRYLAVSRHHCLIDIDPPRVYVRDLGSRNGTYVNGRDIGRRPRAEGLHEAVLLDLPRRELHEGDEVRIADTVFRVQVNVGDEMPDFLPAGRFEPAGTVACEVEVGACI